MALEISTALATGHPLDMLAYASGLINLFDPRTDRDSAPLPVDRATFVSSMQDVDMAETTAMLLGWRLLSSDDAEKRRITAGLSGRRPHRLPSWLSHVDAVRVASVQVITEPLGDATQHVIELRWPDDTPLTIAVMRDANVGYALVDVITAPVPASELLGLIAPGSGLNVEDADPALTRAELTQAVDHSAMLYPPIVTDAWPSARPFVEWALRLLPPGAAIPEPPEFDEAAARALASEFVNSSFAEGLNRSYASDIVEDLCWFADYNCGDPLRWSPAKVEQLLCDWWARKVVTLPAIDRAVPDVLGAFVRFCAAKKAIPDDELARTLQAVELCTPEYRQLIRQPRVDTAHMLAQTLAGGALGEGFFDPLDLLASRVGGIHVLDALTPEPLPDEPLDVAELEAQIVERVTTVAAQFDQHAVELGGVELRTATRRLLSQVALLRPDLFRRPSSPVTAACALLFCVLTSNDEISPHKVTGVALAQRFGLAAMPSSRVTTFINALAGTDWEGDWREVTHPSILTSTTRQQIIERREALRSLT